MCFALLYIEKKEKMDVKQSFVRKISRQVTKNPRQCSIEFAKLTV